ncbi:hypothetical protein HZA99_03890 [Candidatus Woesearchaeota archaeon]|nr:hypothetical protein [Candidatus Woesearchaeota archaeon]
MTTITINVQDTVAQHFRKRVHQLYGKKKGNLGKAIAEAMQEWVRKKEHLDTCMLLLEKGVNMGKLKYSTRDEIYDRS